MRLGGEPPWVTGRKVGADEPYEGILHVRIWGGRRGQPRPLPGRRTAAPLLRSAPGGSSDAPFTLYRPCRRRSLTSGVLRMRPLVFNLLQPLDNSPECSYVSVVECRGVFHEVAIRYNAVAVSPVISTDPVRAVADSELNRRIG
jgi:hypothetical protein